MSIETKNPNQQETKKPGWLKRHMRRIGAGAMIGLVGAGAGAAINEASHDHSQSLTSHEKTVHFSPKPAEKGSKFEGLDGRQLVIAEQAEARKDLDTVAKADAYTVIDSLRDPAMAAEQTEHGLGLQNKSSHEEGRVDDTVRSSYANYNLETSTVTVGDYSKEDGSTFSIFNVPAEAINKLEAERQHDGHVDLDDLKTAIENPDTHVRHFGAAEGQWDVKKNKGVGVNVSRSGEITLQNKTGNFDDIEAGPFDTIASPTDIDSIVKLAKKVGEEKNS